MTERTIFLTALEKNAAERTAYLDEACGADANLRQRVEDLLRSHDEAENFLDVPALAQIASSGEPLGPSGDTLGEQPAGQARAPSLDFLTPPQRPDSLGRLGHYEVLEVIGQGGFGTVLRAFDEKLHRVVAIKVLAPALATNGTACRRFVREAQAAAAVKNDHVIAIYNVEDEHQPPYLVMELIDGISLQDRLDRQGPVADVREILRIGVQTAEGLAAAHKQGLVHRDIKPANILLENGVQRVKITDFGLARAVDDASLSQSGVVAGTPQYMSPEQAEGLPVDHRSDLFSLGSVLYALCAGHAPFRASGTMAVLKHVCEEIPRPIRELNPDIPDWLVAIVNRLHAKNPADRFQSATEVAELLSRHLAHVQQPTLMPRPINVATPNSVTVGVKSAFRRQAKPALRRPWRRSVLPMALMFLSLLGVSWFLFFSHYSGYLTNRGAVEFAPQSGLTSLIVLQNDAMVTDWLDMRTSHTISLSPGKYQVNPGCKPGYGILEGMGWELTTVGIFGDQTVRHGGPSCELEIHRGERVIVRAMPSKLRVAAEHVSLRLEQDGAYRARTANYEAVVSKNGLLTHLRAGDLELLRPGEGYYHGGLFVEEEATRPLLQLRPVEQSGGSVLTSKCDSLAVRYEFSPESLTWTLTSGSAKKICFFLCFGPAVKAARGEQGAWAKVPLEIDWPPSVSWFANPWKFHITGGTRIWLSKKQPVPQQIWQAILLPGETRRVQLTIARISEGEAAKVAELTGPRPAAQPAGKPFVILARDSERRCDSLADAVAGAGHGDAIEVRGNGPFVTPPLFLQDMSLTIRAGTGFRPVIRLNPEGVRANVSLLKTNAPLILEGLELQRIGQEPYERGSPVPRPVITAEQSPLYLANCRFVVKETGTALAAHGARVCRVRNCEFISTGTAFAHLNWILPDEGRLEFDNCVVLGGEFGVGFLYRQPAHGATAGIRRSTFVVKEPFLVQLDIAPPSPTRPKESKPLHIDAEGNVFAAAGSMLDFVQSASSIREYKAISLGEAESFLPHLLSWQGQQNVFPPRGLLGISIDWKDPQPAARCKDLADWKRFWASAEKDSVSGQARFGGGDLHAKAFLNLEQLTPADFRLRPGSPGHGGNGADRGADINLVGPGPAYERWKATPEYQGWNIRIQALSTKP